MSYRQVVLSFGYVESSQAGVVALQPRYGEPPKTVEQTLTSVADSLFQIWWAAAEPQPSQQEGYCRCCGQSTKADASKIDSRIFDEFQRWLVAFPGLTADEIPDEGDWDPWISYRQLLSVPTEEILEVRRAEHTLLWFLDLDGFEDTGWVRRAWEFWAKEINLQQRRTEAIQFNVGPEDESA